MIITHPTITKTTKKKYIYMRYIKKINNNNIKNNKYIRSHQLNLKTRNAITLTNKPASHIVH